MLDWLDPVFTFLSSTTIGGFNLIAVIVLVIVCFAIGLIIKGNK